MQLSLEMPLLRMSRDGSAPKTTPSDVSLLDLWAQIPPSSVHRNEDGGRTRVWLMDPKEEQSGAFRTLNFTAWPNDAAVSSLSQTLETGPIPQRFFLCRKACVGIRRRAEERGKELPPMLHRAWSAVAEG